MSRLLHAFVPVFSFGLRLDEALAKGTLSGSVADLYAEARTLLDQSKVAALSAGKRAEHVDSAAFAVVAWVDEIMARNPRDWGGVRPLQVSLFNTNNAGNEFFNQLSALKANEDEVREVYYHALLLGFVGQYYFETGDNGDLGKIKAQHARQLPVPPAPVHVLREEKITPQPYSVADPAGPRFPKQWDKLLLNLGIVLALLIPAGYLLYFYLTPNRDSGPTLQQLVDAQLVDARYACSELVGRVGAGGDTTVTGFVSKPEDIERVRKDVAGLEHMGRLALDVKLRIWPHCEVVELLKDARTRNMAGRAGLAVAIDPDRPGSYIEGEEVTLKLTFANYGGYLYVDYYAADGNVSHLFRGAKDLEIGTPFQPGESVELGFEGIHEAGKRKLRILEPFGQELMTVIASPVPLPMLSDRPRDEYADKYIEALRKTLAEDGAGSQMMANFIFLQTEKKMPGGGQ